MAIQAWLALFGSGRTTGLVVDSGDGVSHAVPIYQGYVLAHGIVRVEVAGKDLTECMMQLLAERGYGPLISSPELARDVKEKLCYVASDFDLERQTCQESSALEKTYLLPDDENITIAEERFRVPELLFRPSLIGLEGVGVHEAVFQALLQCDQDAREELFANVVLAGGTTMFPGLAQRLTQELTTLAPLGMTARVVAPPGRSSDLATWFLGPLELSEFE